MLDADVKIFANSKKENQFQLLKSKKGELAAKRGVHRRGGMKGNGNNSNDSSSNSNQSSFLILEEEKSPDNGNKVFRRCSDNWAPMDRIMSISEIKDKSLAS